MHVDQYGLIRWTTRYWDMFAEKHDCVLKEETEELA